MKCTPRKVIDREMAIREAIAYAKLGDIVCIVGKGPEKYTIKNGVYTHFDEREIVTSALRERGLCE
jgi:UDP-N-acetylmuramoyl-L-alanyl-D-glutamate--2,6-diaminopimelate ligase